jgi:hypothetical protein
MDQVGLGSLPELTILSVVRSVSLQPGLNRGYS